MKLGIARAARSLRSNTSSRHTLRRYACLRPRSCSTRISPLEATCNLRLQKTARAAIRTSEIKTQSPSVRSKWAKLAFFGDETGVGPRKKPTPRGRGGGALRATEAEAQAEAPRALIVICGKPYVEAVSVPLETDTAIYCATRQQAISALLEFDICISNSMQRPVSFVVSSLEGTSRGSSSDSFHEGTNACWLQSSLEPACQTICLWGYYLSEV